MSPWVETFKPAASRRTHLLLAAVMWTVVGALLFYFGSRWVLQAHVSHAYLQIAAAAGLGVVKARFVLDRAAGRIIARIRARGDGRCLGGFLSFKSWGLVVFMVGAGRLLRRGLLPAPVVGLLYTAIGTALVVGARNFWRAFQLERGGSVETADKSR
ncbi:MAG: hypothetical protein V2A79_06015 [Planctomycetota bacterium]